MFSRHWIRVCLILLVTGPLAAANDQSGRIDSDTLRNDQLAVSGRYDRFERLLSQMADILGHEDPERAELLRRAISKGREKAISSQLNQIAEELKEDNFGNALEQQDEVIESLGALLQLLQSEDRRSELEKERERLNRLLKDVSDTLSQQRSARARTRNSTAPSSAAPSQQKAIQRADEVLDDIKTHDPQPDENAEGDGAESEGDAGESESSDGESAPNASDRQSEDSESAESESGDSESDGSESAESSSDDSRPSQSSPQDQDADSSQTPRSPAQDSESQNSKSPGGQSQNSQSQNSESQDSQSQNSESQNSQSQSSPSQSQSESEESRRTPGREQLESARELMQEALEQLQEQLRDKALDKQDGAIEALQQAVEELRKRLLQLREEEKEMVLASLEARFQRMLASQSQIYDETVDLNATPVEQWLDTMFTRSRLIAQSQTDTHTECEQTLGLLKEDGTSVAIVLSVEDIAIDMQAIAERLRGSKTGELTQTLETDVIDSLKELIEATQREMQEMKSEQRQQQSQPGEQKQRPLVELMAEIKVLRSLQLRVNRRTLRVDKLMAEQETDDRTDLLQQLEELTARQQRLVESAAELGERLER